MSTCCRSLRSRASMISIYWILYNIVVGYAGIANYERPLKSELPNAIFYVKFHYPGWNPDSKSRPAYTAAIFAAYDV